MPREYKYSDVDIDFNKNEFVGDVSIKKDRNAIRQSVMNIVLTRKGEKPFNRDFGVGLHDLLFENLSLLDVAAMENRIASQFDRYEPRAAIERFEVNMDEIDSNQVSFTLRYVIFIGSLREPLRETLRLGLKKVR